MAMGLWFFSQAEACAYVCSYGTKVSNQIIKEDYYGTSASP